MSVGQWFETYAAGAVFAALVVGSLIAAFTLVTIRSMINRAVDEIGDQTYQQVAALRDGHGQALGDAVERIQSHAVEQHETTRRALETTGTYTDSQELPVARSLPSVADAQELIDAARVARGGPPPAQTPQQRYPTGSGWQAPGQVPPPPGYQGLPYDASNSERTGGTPPAGPAPQQPYSAQPYGQAGSVGSPYDDTTIRNQPSLAGGEPPPGAARPRTSAAMIGDQLAEEVRRRHERGGGRLDRPEAVPPPPADTRHRHRLDPDHRDYRR